MATAEPRSSDRILQKALELFSTKGYDATSVREICEAAAITKPTLYHFYRSKEGVYRALVGGALQEFRHSLATALEGPGSVSDRLKALARSYFDYTRRRRDLMRFFFGLVYGPPGGAPVTDFHRFYEESVALVAGAVQEGVARGELTPGPIDLRMLVFMGALGEAVCGHLLVGRPDLTPALADTLVDTILDGWRRHQP